MMMRGDFMLFSQVEANKSEGKQCLTYEKQEVDQSRKVKKRTVKPLLNKRTSKPPAARASAAFPVPPGEI
jgi:hypothetical protein